MPGPADWEHAEWRDLTDDELADFTITLSVDRVGDPDETPDWYMLFEHSRLPGYGSSGGSIVHENEIAAAVWSTPSDRELHAAWAGLREQHRMRPQPGR